jgi:Nucleotidyl transferase AbiEii toxin, Type IV TA system
VKDHLRQLTEREPHAPAGRRVAVEYLQARVLQSLQLGGGFLRWAFLGGTALRFLYGIPRFSEDLDFSVITPGTDAGLESAMASAKRAFVAEGYRAEVTLKTQKTVASAFVKFPGLLHELGLSPRTSQTLSIKVEVDTRPPAGAQIETSIVRRHVTLNLCHYDRASLLAGKLHAILTRPWAKGRDLYDLAWYLADRRWPEPNLAMLNAALAQTGWPGPVMNPANWRHEVRQRLTGLDWAAVQADVRPFLEHDHDVELVTPAALSQLLREKEQSRDERKVLPLQFER